MGPTVINGLPAHVLLVHIVVVCVPVAALLLVLSAVWPAARRRLGIITPIVAFVALASIPPTTNAGSWLIKRVDRDPTVIEHARLADGLLPWVIGVFVAALAVWVLNDKMHWFRRGGDGGESVPVPAGVGARGAEAGTEAGQEAPARHAVATATRTAPRWLLAARVVVAVIALVVAVGSVVEVYRVGDSGAHAAWHDGFSMTPKPAPTDDH